MCNRKMEQEGVKNDCYKMYSTYNKDEQNLSSDVKIIKHMSYSSTKETICDLCPDCTKDLEKWFGSENKEDK